MLCHFRISPSRDTEPAATGKLFGNAKILSIKRCLNLLLILNLQLSISMSVILTVQPLLILSLCSASPVHEQFCCYWSVFMRQNVQSQVHKSVFRVFLLPKGNRRSRVPGQAPSYVTTRLVKIREQPKVSSIYLLVLSYNEKG